MILEKDAIRVEGWITEAFSGRTKLVVSGKRHGALYTPTVVADVKPEMRTFCEGLFRSAVAVTRGNDLDEALALANDSIYGLAAGIFTENLGWAMEFAQGVQCGNLHINGGPQWRADIMVSYTSLLRF